MEDEQTQARLDALVLKYLEKRGYNKALKQFKEEAPPTQNLSLRDMATKLSLENSTQMQNIIMFWSKDEEHVGRYQDSYSTLEDWCRQSLDMYKPELMSILYPVFVHCYLELVYKHHHDAARKFMEEFSAEHAEMHDKELKELAVITTRELMQDDHKVKVLRGSKFRVTMCSFSFELLMTFLHENSFMLLLGIINRYINIQVFSGNPQALPIVEFPSVRDENERIAMHQKDIYWGLYPEQLPKKPKTDAMEVDGENEKEKNARKRKREEMEAAQVKPKVPIPSIAKLNQLRVKEELDRVALSSKQLPSIACYTFFNTYDGLNCVAISDDCSLVAGGFEDSSIRIWDLQKGQSAWEVQATRFKNGQSDGRAIEYRRTSDAKYARLVAHYGAVFSLDFSVDNQYLLSSSCDATVRLWSMETQTNLVVYRGHNSPVWCVRFSPMGLYFATASTDTTARFWSTDHLSPHRVFIGHLSDINCVEFHPNCNYIFTGSHDKAVRMWDIHSGECRRIFTGHTEPISTIAVCPSGRYIASGGEDKKILIHDLVTNKLVGILKGHTAAVWSLSFSYPKGAILASGSEDKTVKLWDIAALTGKHESETNTTDASKTTIKTEGSTKKETLNVKEVECVKSFLTKDTPLFRVKFTRKNLLVAAGPFKPKKQVEGN
mmetsp:Transcript_5675/g.6154  ORF Transcript_5675/g.6154 Transcript_5675/m.6154 type:complete len:662 (+) Transcript_5675:56-2041(+)